MKKVLSILLTVLMVFSVLYVGVSAATVYTSGSYEYTVSKNEATIKKYTGSASSLTVPSTIDSYKVSTIGESAFRDCNSLVNVVISEGITVIGNSAFKNCAQLVSVSIPSTVTTVTTYTNGTSLGAFDSCTKLKTVKIAAGTKDARFGSGTFYNCISLESIVIPGNYIDIGSWAFYNCTTLKSMELKKSPYPTATQTIGTSAFEGCTSMKSISLPTTLNTIRDGAFRNCDALTDVVIPEGVTEIGNRAFKECDQLISVSIPSTVTKVTTYTGGTSLGAFDNCTKLKKVIIAEGTKDATIGCGTFLNCKSLTTVHIPSNYVKINSWTFDGCPNVTICNTTSNCYAKTYADQNGIPFKICSNNHSEAKKFTVTFNANGGSVSPTSVTVGEGIAVTVPTPTRNGYTCLGWATSSSASSATVDCGAGLKPSENITLYAVWKKSAEPIVMNVELNYKSTVKAAINGFNAEKYSTDNSGIAAVSSDGTITGTGRGSTTVHAYDKSGNEAKINVTVNYAWWQWIIKIVLFGWIWY